MTVLTKAWLEARIAKRMEMVEAYEAAVLALESDPEKYTSYTVRTADTTETVTHSDVGRMRSAIASWMNDIATMEARLCGASRYVRPGF